MGYKEGEDAQKKFSPNEFERFIKEYINQIPGSGIFVPSNIAEDFMLMYMAGNSKFFDVTDDPDLQVDLKPKNSDDNPIILLGERPFSKGRTYRVKAPSEGYVGLTHEQYLLANGTQYIVKTASGSSRGRQLREVLLSLYTTASRVTPAAFTAGTIIVRRVGYDRKGPPGVNETYKVIEYQIDATHNAGLLGFKDLVIQLEPAADLSYYEEIQVEITPSGNYGYLDVLIPVVFQ